MKSWAVSPLTPSSSVGFPFPFLTQFAIRRTAKEAIKLRVGPKRRRKKRAVHGWEEGKAMEWAKRGRRCAISGTGNQPQKQTPSPSSSSLLKLPN